MSYHPGSNLAGEDGYGLRGMNPETTSTDRSTSTLHSTSMTRTSKTDPFSTFPDDDSESGKFIYVQILIMGVLEPWATVAMISL